MLRQKRRFGWRESACSPVFWKFVFHFFKAISTGLCGRFSVNGTDLWKWWTRFRAKFTSPEFCLLFAQTVVSFAAVFRLVAWTDRFPKGFVTRFGEKRVTKPWDRLCGRLSVTQRQIFISPMTKRSVFRGAQKLADGQRKNIKRRGNPWSQANFFPL